MTESGKQTDHNAKPERKPVVLSNKEALYPPSKHALTITIAAIVVAVIALVAYLICTF